MHASEWLAEQGCRIDYIDTRQQGPWRHWPWRCLGMRSANIIIFRSLKDPWLRWLERHRRWLGPIYYVIDDDILAAARDWRLPDEYRDRMRELVCDWQPRILALATEVIACSQHLTEILRCVHPRVSCLPPAMISPFPKLNHFNHDRIEIGFHGTRAHLHDLKAILPALIAIHEGYANSRIEVMLGRNAPTEVQALERFHIVDPLRWPEFLAYRNQRRIHIGLAPLWPTVFNRSKSWIKFFDITAMGGVGIYSDREPYRSVVEHDRNGLLVPDDVMAWQEAIASLIDDPGRMRRMAMAAAETAVQVGALECAKSFWGSRSRPPVQLG